MPFIRTFELAVDRLVAVRKDLQTEGAESSVRAAERNYRERMVEINNSFESVTQSSSTMEYKINEVGRTAVRVGEQLENIHVSRQRAQAAYDLVDYYNQFSRGNTSKLDTLREEGGREGRAQTAVILRRLNAVTKEVDLPNAEAVSTLPPTVIPTNHHIADTRGDRQVLRNLRERHAQALRQVLPQLRHKANGGKPFIAPLTIHTELNLLKALCTNAPRLQWRRILRRDVCQPTRVLHLAEPHP